MQRLRHAGTACFVLLAAALVWRAFFYSRPASQPSVVAHAPTMKRTQAATEPELILDLFSPSDDVLAGQRTQSTLVRQVEEAITASFLLRRCQLMTANEYQGTYRALQRYILQTRLAADEPSAIVELTRISESAKATYGLIYARSPCETPALSATAATLAQWREAMLKQP